MEEDKAEEVQEEASECEDPAESHDICTGTRQLPHFDVQHPCFLPFRGVLMGATRMRRVLVKSL